MSIFCLSTSEPKIQRLLFVFDNMQQHLKLICFFFLIYSDLKLLQNEVQLHKITHFCSRQCWSVYLETVISY